jgi:GNAT superfamily N-acetyltransferase
MAFDSVTVRMSDPENPQSRIRRAVAAAYQRPVPGMELSFESYIDPPAWTDSYAEYGEALSRRLKFEVNKQRRRVYLFAYVEGASAGHLSAYVHTNNTALIRKIDVDDDYQRRGIASALYETLRAEFPGLLVEHGAQSPDAQAWWTGYCHARQLDPTDPLS